MSGLDLDAIQNYLKRRYDQNPFRDGQLYGKGHLLNDLIMKGRSGPYPGEAIVTPVKVGRTTHLSPSFEDAQSLAKTNTGVRDRFIVPWNFRMHDVARIDDEAVATTAGSEGSFVDALDDEIGSVYDSAITGLSAGITQQDVWYLGDSKAGTAGIDASDKTLTLADGTPTNRLEAGMPVDIRAKNDEDNGDKILSTTIEKVNRDTGVLTLNSVTGLVTTDGDEVYQVYYNASINTSSKILSLVDWLPGSSVSSDVFAGMDRSQDGVRLGGVLRTPAAGIDASSQSIVDEITKAYVQLIQNYKSLNTKVKKSIDCVYVNPVTHQLIINELRDQGAVRYNKSDGFPMDEKKTFGFSGVGIWAAGDFLEVKQDMTVAPNQVFGLNLDTWGLKWKGSGLKQWGPIRLFRAPENNGYLRTAHDQAGYEVRLHGYAALVCYAPGLNFRLDLSNFTKVSTYLDATTA